MTTPIEVLKHTKALGDASYALEELARQLAKAEAARVEAAKRISGLEADLIAYSSEREARQADKLSALRAALERSMVALDDWLHMYAADQCDPAKVLESAKRIAEAGATLAYIASAQQQNRAALASGKEK